MLCADDDTRRPPDVAGAVPGAVLPQNVSPGDLRSWKGPGCPLQVGV